MFFIQNQHFKGYLQIFILGLVKSFFTNAFFSKTKNDIKNLSDGKVWATWGTHYKIVTKVGGCTRVTGYCEIYPKNETFACTARPVHIQTLRSITKL